MRHKTFMLALLTFQPSPFRGSDCFIIGHVFILKAPTMLNVSSRACQGWVLGPIPWKYSGCGITTIKHITKSISPWHNTLTLQWTPIHPKSCSTLPHSHAILWPHHTCPSESTPAPCPTMYPLQTPLKTLNKPGASLPHWPAIPLPPLPAASAPPPELTQLTTVTAQTCHPANHYYSVLLLMFSYCFNVTHFLSCYLFLTKTASNLVFA